MKFNFAAVAAFAVGVPCLAMAEEAAPGKEVGVAAKIEIWRHNRLHQVQNEDSDALAEFTTDGCSGGMSAAWAAMAGTFPAFERMYQQQAPWHNCCVEHDRAYHLGGSGLTAEASYLSRLDADEDLRLCVQTVAQSQSDALALQYDQSAEDVALAINFVADRMYDAVRVGGLPCSGLPWRWGYGWPQCY